MATILEAKKFSLFNADGKNNKFWNITLYDNGDVEVHFGPQGLSGQRKLHSAVGRSFFDKKIREKSVYVSDEKCLLFTYRNSVNMPYELGYDSFQSH